MAGSPTTGIASKGVKCYPPHLGYSSCVSGAKEESDDRSYPSLLLLLVCAAPMTLMRYMGSRSIGSKTMGSKTMGSKTGRR